MVPGVRESYGRGWKMRFAHQCQRLTKGLRSDEPDEPVCPTLAAQVNRGWSDAQNRMTLPVE
jgi:hypothetical protein